VRTGERGESQSAAEAHVLADAAPAHGCGMNLRRYSAAPSTSE
jgi:hypothetical protein